MKRPGAGPAGPMEVRHGCEVSFLVPCRNEAGTIYPVLEAIYQQTYPRERIEVIVAEGQSEDGTQDQIDRFIQDRSDLRVAVMDNPDRSAPAGLNRALAKARGTFILRMDAHTIPDADYVARCLETLRKTRSDGVGGVWEIQPGGPGAVAGGIAIAAAHPFGVGDARYRIGGKPGWVDTVPFGAYRREVFDRVGRFDERVAVNEDYDFNYRLRAAGGKLYFNPEIRSRYIARSTLRALSRQYYRYGFQKATMLSYHPGSLRWRQMAAPLFVLTLLLFGLVGLRSQRVAEVFLVEIGAYLFLAIGAALHQALRRKDATLILTLPLAFVTMHLSWGTGFWLGQLRAAARHMGAERKT